MREREKKGKKVRVSGKYEFQSRQLKMELSQLRYLV